jgi:predicted ArsR family transcriptional regulator
MANIIRSILIDAPSTSAEISAVSGIPLEKVCKALATMKLRRLVRSTGRYAPHSGVGRRQHLYEITNQGRAATRRKAHG